MDCLSNISGAELAALANTISICISKNFSKDDIAKLVVFFTALADILALLDIDNVGDTD